MLEGGLAGVAAAVQCKGVATELSRNSPNAVAFFVASRTSASGASARLAGLQRPPAVSAGGTTGS